jgi:ER membrane protein complex subunit 2
LLRSLQQPEKAIEWLVELVRLNPTDVEAWSELSELYVSVGMYPQAVFASEEVLLSLPNAWNVRPSLLPKLLS